MAEIQGGLFLMLYVPRKPKLQLTWRGMAWSFTQNGRDVGVGLPEYLWYGETLEESMTEIMRAVYT